MRIALLGLAGFLLAAQENRVAHLPGATRAEVIATAMRLANHRWTPLESNLRAPCVHTAYVSDFRAGVPVQGLAYDWGGMDSPESFERKLKEGQAAGSHSQHGVTSCTAGTDCSGFVTMCWKQKPVHEFSTATVRQIAGRPRYNVFTDMKPGDALNKAGSHIVLFVRYNPDGTPFVCEASGSAKRVVCRSRTWTSLRGYHPLVYKAILDP
jgi:hypothetical protein